MSDDTAKSMAVPVEAEDVAIARLDQEDTEDDDDLPTLLAEATAAYSQKHYREAAELYSRATELQAEQNGEMSTKNAELLYLYGRCLYHVAVEKSDVLGEKVAGEKPKEKDSKRTRNGQNVPEEQEKRIAEEGVAAVANGDVKDEKDVDESKPSATKPYFQFTGDENFDDSEEEAEAGEAEADGPEPEEDEFMNAFEILDLARVLLQRQLEESQHHNESGPPTDQDTITRIKERLADTHDLQAEISLEGEQFLAAVSDFRSSLAIKQDLYPPESSYLAELHFKLSLALEFASVTQPKDAQGEIDPNQVSTVDEAMREEAAKEMEAAISCCKQRIEKEETALAAGQEVLLPGRKEKVTQKSISDVREMVADMEQRLIELRQPPVSINDPRGTGALDGATPLNGILGAILGESAEQQKQRLEEANKQAKDITGLVRKREKKPTTDEAASALAESNGSKAMNGTTASVSETETKLGTKRKVGFAEEVTELGNGKRARVEGDDEADRN